MLTKKLVREFFFESFRGNISSCEAHCHCGNIYYCPSDTSSWFDDQERLIELKAKNLQDPKKYIAINTNGRYLHFQGAEYVDQCKCWHEQAYKFHNFIHFHDTNIADYFQRLKKFLSDQADKVPVLDPEGTGLSEACNPVPLTPPAPPSDSQLPPAPPAPPAPPEYP